MSDSLTVCAIRAGTGWEQESCSHSIDSDEGGLLYPQYRLSVSGHVLESCGEISTLSYAEKRKLEVVEFTYTEQ